MAETIVVTVIAVSAIPFVLYVSAKLLAYGFAAGRDKFERDKTKRDKKENNSGQVS